MIKYTVLSLIILSQLFACKKSSTTPPGGGGGPDTTGTATGDFKDIYVVGFMNYDPSVLNATSATLWKNGTATRLSNLPSAAYDVSVDDSTGDVFVVGSTPVTGSNDTYATYWLNGVEHHLTDGFSHAIATSVAIGYYKTGPGVNDLERRVFICGTDQYFPGGGVVQYQAVYWDENGIEHNIAPANSQCTDNGGIGFYNYPLACGYQEGNSPSSGFAAIWPSQRNNDPSPPQPKVGLSPGSIVNGMTLALFLQPDTTYKIYACGKDKVPGETNFRATLWIEGTPTYLTNGSTYSTAEDISVTLDSKAYICGEERFGSQTTNTAVYWKPDGTVVKLTDSTKNAFATNIIARKNTVLVCGHEAGPTGAGMPQIFIAKYWKNGVAVNLSDGIHSANAYGMTAR